MTHDYYFHTPGHPSRWAVLDVGLKCTHSCKFCYYSFLDGTDDQFSGMRHAKFHSKENLMAMLDGMVESGFLGFDVTGGEPTLHPDIVEIIRYASKLGLSSRIITLGQWLMRPMKNTGDKILLDALLDVGLTNFLFSYHACSSSLFNTITGEDLAKLEAAMNELDRRYFSYTTNTTVFEDNYKHLPMLAEKLTQHNTYLHNFIVQNAYYEWSTKNRSEGVQAHYSEVAPYIKEAIDILEASGRAVNVRYVPMCTMAGYEKNVVGIVGVRYDPYEWMNQIDHKADPATLTLEGARNMGRRIPMVAGHTPGADIFGVTGHAGKTELCAARGVRIEGQQPQVSKLFPSQCQSCSQVAVCDGIDPNYLSLRGDSEFVPYMEFAADGTLAASKGPLDPRRLAYRAPFFVKRKQDADMCRLVRRTLNPLNPALFNPILPLVSVIVTSYNYGKYLRQCLDSLLSQTYKQVEIIVVDDGSDDSTPDVCRAPEYRDKISYIYQPNFGQPSGPRNTGIDACTGELIMCLDADDWVEPTYIEECVRLLEEHPEASVVFPGTQCRNEDGAKLEQCIYAVPFDMDALLNECRIVCVSMFRRDAFGDTGGYKHNVRGCEDWNQWIEMAGLGHIGINLPRQLFNYRRHADGIFDTEVLPNHDAKHRQIVLNNSDIFPPGMVKMAREGKKVERLVD